MGRDKSIKDLDASMRAKHLVVQKNHLDQIASVRAESYEQGLQAGKKEVLSKSSDIIDVRRATAPLFKMPKPPKIKSKLDRESAQKSKDSVASPPKSLISSTSEVNHSCTINQRRSREDTTQGGSVKRRIRPARGLQSASLSTGRALGHS